MEKVKVVIVGGGFAGMSCASKLVTHPNIHVTLLDKNNYHEFTPLLYQVATSALSIEDVATSIRHHFEGRPNIDIKMAEATAVDPASRMVKTAEGDTYQGDILVLAAGATVNFFNTPGARQYSFPLYSLTDAERLRSRLIAAFEDADRDPKLIEKGVLNFIVVGAGPTGIEIAGAISDMLNVALPKEFLDLALSKAQVYVIDHSPTVLSAFSEKSREYAARILGERNVQLCLGLLVKEAGDDYVVLSNGERILTKTIIWAGGLKASALADACSLQQGHGGRIDILPDLTVHGFANIYALGDFANVPGSDGKALPQLASVAKQSGEWAASNILARLEGRAGTPFKYNDKGIMAMIGRNAAIAEIGKKRRHLKGFFAYLAWLGVHAALLSTLRQKIGAFFEWAWDYFGRTQVLQILDRGNEARIIWKGDNKDQP